MGVTIVVGSVVYVLVAAGVSWWFWACLSGGEPSTSATIRNLVLIWGTPLAIFLAVWRSIVAQKQAVTAQKQAAVAQEGLISDRYQRAAEMLGHDLATIRIGGIYTLLRIGLEGSEHYQLQVHSLLKAYDAHLGREVSDYEKIMLEEALTMLRIVTNEMPLDDEDSS